MISYSPAVAIFDFVPVLISACGLLILARALASRHRTLGPVVWSAALLIPLGGACKASWKLIAATQQQDIAWLGNLLFILLAPGFVVLSFGFYHACQAWRLGTAPDAAQYPRWRLRVWLLLVAGGGLTAALAFPHTRLWFVWLLAVTTVANAALIVQAILAAHRSRMHKAVIACLGYSFAATLALSGLARLPAGEATAWIQEAVNLSAQAALTLAFWRIALRMQREY